ncbi:MAG: PfkB family carbohydrate kinase [Cyanobacteria bacterium J06639_1]
MLEVWVRQQPSRGVFVGLISLDIEYLADDPPTRNQKVVARDYAIASGGPATNAAVAFAACGNASTIAGSLGNHPVTQLIRADLKACRVAIADLTPDRTEPPPTSSIVVTERTGDRAVISLNAIKQQASPKPMFPDGLDDSGWLDGVDIVLIDGHQMAVGAEIARLARDRGIPVVVDGGSWKPGFEHVLKYATFAIASANFHPPNCRSTEDVFAYLSSLHVPHIAVTRGAEAILYRSTSTDGAIAVPCVDAIDTLGAGDVFHGVFCHFIAYAPFDVALERAALVASEFCTSFGTREWLQTFRLSSVR